MSEKQLENGSAQALQPEAAAEQTQSQHNPLFFKNPHPIALERHAQAGLSNNPSFGFSFAKETNSIPVNLVEFNEIARSYPIVFTASENTVPIALVGLESKNLFITAKNQWRSGHYVPAYVRKYPFALLESPDKQQWILCVDEGAPHFMPSAPDLPFYEGEKHTDMAQRALDFCGAFQQHYRQTAEFCEALKKHGLLTERVSTMRLHNGSNINLRGFLSIDEEKFAALDDEIILEWHKKGWLAAIHAVLLSTGSWKYLARLMESAEEAD
jgi:hypothetical protein